MNPNRPTLSSVFLSLPLVCALSAMVAMPSAQAADLYWDVNGSTAGFSTVAGTWNTTTNLFWNTDSTGGGAGTLSAVTTSADDLFIRQATTNTGTIALTGANKSASSITFAANVGPTTIAASQTITIGGTGAFSGIRQQSTGANIINSPLALNSANTAFNISNSSTGLLTLSGGVTGMATSGNVTQMLTIGSTSSGNIRISGFIADVSGSASAVALTVNNTSTGVTELTAANTYTGGTTISAGTLSLGAGGNNGAIVGNVANSGILAFNRSVSDTYGGIVSGTGAVTKSGASTMTLTGANSYDGTTTISAGSLNVQHATGLGSTVGGTTVANNAALQLQGGITVGAEALTLNGTGVSSTGALLNVSGDNTYGGAITRGAATTIGSTAGTLTLSGTMGGNFATTFTGAGNITSSGVISGNSGITKSGAGTLTLSGANTYTGLTTVSDGTLLYGASNVISTGAVTVNGATAILNLGANQSDSVGTVTLAGGGQINGSGTSTLTSTGVFTMQSGSVSAILAGDVALNKTTAGTVTLSGANTYTGLTTVSAGTLAYGNSNVIGTGAVTVTGGILNLGADQSDSVGTVTLTGGGQINGSGTSTLTSTGTFEMRSGSVSAILAGDVALNKTTSGTVTLSGANTYTGATTISQDGNGVLVINGDNSGATGAITITLGTLQLGNGGTTGKLSTSSAIVNNATLRINRSDAVAQGTDFTGAAITGNGALVHLGAGTTTLSAANTFTGNTTVSGGKVALTNPLALQFSAYNTLGSNGTTIGMDVSDPSALDSGKLTLGGLVGAVDLAGAFTAGFTGSVNNLTLNPVATRTPTYSGVIADGASGMTLTKTGLGTQTLSGDNTYTGDTTVNEGILAITHNNALGTTAGKTVVDGVNGRLTLSNNITVAEPITISGYVNTSGLLSSSGTNIISGPVTITNFGARVGASDGSTLTFTGGVTAATADMIFVVNPGSPTVPSGGTLAFTTTPLALMNSGRLYQDFGGVVALGVAGNTFGRVTIGLGTMRLDVENALPSIAEVVMGLDYRSNGGTLDLNGNSQTIFGLRNDIPGAGVSSLVVTSATAATLTLDSSTPGTVPVEVQPGLINPALTSTTAFAYAGTITGALSIVKEGPNTATFSGANTYTGGTTINGGTLALGSAGALGSSGTIAFGGGTLQHSASNTTDYSARFSTAASQQYSIDTNSQNVTLATALTSTGGSFTKLGAGTLTLTGANTYDGTTTINGGVLVVTNGAAIADTGAVILADVSGANLTVQNSETIGSLRGGGTTGGNVTIASAQTLTVAETGSQTFAGIISDAGGLTKTAAGTLTLTGANTYTGGTTINGGTLALGSAGAIGSSGTIAFGGGTLQYSASNTTDYSDRFSNGASQQYSIDTNSENVTLASNLTSSGGSLAKLGAGTLTLSGTNTYSGATTVSAGALQVGSSGLGQTGTGAVTVQTGSTLLGTGLVQGSTFTLDNGGTLRPGDSLVDSSHGTLTFDPVSPSGDTSLQGNIILGISGATITDTTYGGNLLGSAGYNNWVDSISGIGAHDQLVFLGTGGHNVSFLTTTGSLQVVSSSFTPARGQVFNLIDWASLMNPNMNFTGFTFNNGYLTGNADEGADLDLPDLSGSGLAWDMSRFTTSGNIVVVPEPSRALLLMFGLACLAMRRQTPSHPVPALRPGPTRLRPRKRNFLADFCPTSGFTGRARPSATGPVE